MKIQKLSPSSKECNMANTEDFKQFSYLSSLINIISKDQINFNIDNKATTAYFDLNNKVISLPEYVFKLKDVIVNERLICHEVAHALYTKKDIFSQEKKISKMLINLVEDIRIENLFKDNFIGCGKLFSEGWIRFDKLVDNHFYNRKNINENLFINRMNDYFKSNYFQVCKFNDKEQVIIDKLKELKNDDDVIPLVKEIIKLIKQSKEQEQTEEQEKKSEKVDGQSEINESSENDGKEGNAKDDSISEQELSDDEMEELSDEIMEESKLKNEEEFIEKLKKEYDRNTIRTMIPSDVLIITEKQLWKEIPDLKFMEKGSIETFEIIEKNAAVISAEFNRKKSSKNYRNLSRVKTGSLDLSKIGKAYTSQEIFSFSKKVKNQKNHEVVILLDWSSSISHMIEELVIQACTLYYFCYRNNIKCTIYAFSNNPTMYEKFFVKDTNFDLNKSGEQQRQEVYKRHLDKFGLNETSIFKCYPFALLELLGPNSAFTKERLLKLLNLSKVMTHRNSFYIPDYHNVSSQLRFMKLSGTPLFASLLKMGNLLKAKSSKDKILNLICISDGQSDDIGLSSATTQTNKNYKDINLSDGQSDDIALSSDTTILDLQTNKIYKDINLSDEASTMNFLCERLYSMIPNLKCNHIHVGETPLGCFSSNGFLDSLSNDQMKEHKSNLLSKLKSNGMAFIKFRNFNSIMFVQDVSSDDKTRLLNDNTKVQSKNTSINILKKLNSSLSQIIYKKIAEFIA